MNARPDRLAPHLADLPLQQVMVPGVRICLCDEAGDVARCVDVPLADFSAVNPLPVASRALQDGGGLCA